MLLILYFDITLRFPLENKTLLKKWVDSIGLSNWQPTYSDRVCSDHFENDDVLRTNDMYGLKNDAIPSIKPQVCIRLLGNNSFLVISLSQIFLIFCRIHL